MLVSPGTLAAVDVYVWLTYFQFSVGGKKLVRSRGLPDLAAGKLPEAKDLAMLRSGPRVDVPCDEAYLGSRATEAGECPRGCSRNSTAA